LALIEHEEYAPLGQHETKLKKKITRKKRIDEEEKERSKNTTKQRTMRTRESWCCLWEIIFRATQECTHRDANSRMCASDASRETKALTKKKIG